MKMKPLACSLLLTGLFIGISTVLRAQNTLPVQQFDIKQLPDSIEYEGDVMTAVRWTDKAGINIVITTETNIHFSKKFKHDNDGRDAELFAYHFLMKGNKVVQTWRLNDFVADCPVDLEASFIENTFQVTDLNHDGIGEIWLMYKKGCHGDVSPVDLKIIMYQGKQKFAMRGTTKVFDGKDNNSKDHFSGGAYKFDEAFTKGPAAFMVFARKLWQQNVEQ